MDAGLRWLIDPPADGPTNMSRDEALIESVGPGHSPPTLRFYRWTPPTISLGYFQTYAEFATLPPPAGDLPTVRRLTGGGAILHDQELTYALVLPTTHPLVRETGPNRLYDHVHQAFARILTEAGVPVVPGPAGQGRCAQRGPFFCFERHACFDLLVDGRKIMGSAQRRTRSAVLQHGSLILANRFEQHRCAAVTDHAAIDVESLLPQLAPAIAGADVDAPSRLSSEEEQLADRLRAKYADPAWTRKR